MLSQQVFKRRTFSRLNILLLLALLVYSCLGIWSTSVASEGQYGLFIKHLAIIVLGFGVFTLVGVLGYRKIQTFVWPLYGLMNFLLLLVLLMGPQIAGAQRWLYLGSFSFQPSELAKLVLVLSLSLHLASIRVWHLFNWLGLLAHLAVPCLLVLKEPDLGMTLVLGGIFMAMLLVSPISLWILSLLAAPSLSVGLFFWSQTLWLGHLMLGLVVLLTWFLLSRWSRKPLRRGSLFMAGLLLLNASIIGLGNWFWQHLQPYQQQRILSFVSPSSDTLSSGYQVMQSKIAVGAGGLWGQGLFAGSQTQLGFVPEQHTDFIFSALAEELGFVGTAFLLVLFGILIFRVLWIGFQARESEQLYICTGVAALLLMQVLINVGMNMEIMPVTGVPLPLISYGGTSMLFQMALLGLVESVYLQQRSDLPEEWL